MRGVAVSFSCLLQHPLSCCPLQVKVQARNNEKTNAGLSWLVLLEERAGGHSVPSSFNSESSTLLPVPKQAKQSLGPPSSPRCHQANFVHWGQQIQNPEPNSSVRPMEMSENLGGGGGAKFKLNQETAAPKVESHEQQYSRTD